MATDLRPSENTFYIIYTNELKRAVRSAGAIIGGKETAVSAPAAFINSYTNYATFEREWEDVLGQEALYINPFVEPTLNSDNPNYFSPRPVDPPAE